MLPDYFAEIAATEKREQAAAALRARVKTLEAEMRCNCDLDNWEPERSTGHSWVCRIHKAATALKIPASTRRST